MEMSERLKQYPVEKLLRVLANVIIRYETDAAMLIVAGSPRALRRLVARNGLDPWSVADVAEYIVKAGYGEKVLAVLEGTLQPPEELVELPTIGNRKITEN